MRKFDWKAALELIGISAVVVSLILVALELRQSQVIGRMEAFATIATGQIAARDAINRDADIWTRGAGGGDLDELEQVIFGNLVRNLNDDAVSRYLVQSRLGFEIDAELVVNDFAVFLFQNPGARRVWLEREVELNHSREILRPNENARSFWQEEVSEALERLDTAYQ